MGGHQVPGQGSGNDGYDEEGYDESQRAEILEATRDGPSDGVVLTDLDPDIGDEDDEDEPIDELNMDSEAVGETDATVTMDEDDMDEDDVQDELDDGSIDCWGYSGHVGLLGAWGGLTPLSPGGGGGGGRGPPRRRNGRRRHPTFIRPTGTVAVGQHRGMGCGFFVLRCNERAVAGFDCPGPARRVAHRSGPCCNDRGIFSHA